LKPIGGEALGTRDKRRNYLKNPRLIDDEPQLTAVQTAIVTLPFSSAGS
jgi:hypothetical protein